MCAFVILVLELYSRGAMRFSHSGLCTRILFWLCVRVPFTSKITNPQSQSWAHLKFACICSFFCGYSWSDHQSLLPTRVIHSKTHAHTRLSITQAVHDNSQNMEPAEWLRQNIESVLAKLLAEFTRSVVFVCLNTCFANVRILLVIRSPGGLRPEGGDLIDSVAKCSFSTTWQTCLVTESRELLQLSSIWTGFRCNTYLRVSKLLTCNFK